ncbi:hypothetical protein BN946_scf185015.g129 [Trametes cinnabarina]|uniref:Protein AF-9 homolog n=1 Tax=Pycnoporus cinnabarinus TaxID=5643 RepID=A0A060SHG0_PYCCI|nr:hypothetical protein BN946_scf185015.g129 [Trametes cinnabarina]
MASNDRVRVRGVDIHRPIIYGNTAVVLSQKEREALPTPDHTHRWTVAVRSAASAPDSDIVGGADDLSYFIKRVTFKLHDTYPNPNRNVDKPPFEVSETGWGEFEITIRITFPEIPPLEEAAKMGPVHSWQYDEIVFRDPFQSFLNILTAHPPTPLPKNKRRPIPFHMANPGSLEASKGGTPEFTQEMEKEEADRLDAAKQKLAQEHSKLVDTIVKKEKELEALKKELDKALQGS